MFERYRGKTIGILGLGKSGQAAARKLASAGADIVLFDDRPAAMKGLSGTIGTEKQIKDLDLLIASPGVPLTHPIIQQAKRANISILGDVDVFLEAIGPRRIIGITGTNGKSTTTALTHHLLLAAGRDSVMGGNIGEPVFDLDPGDADRILVLELSSFQLDLARSLHCNVAVWLNTSADHLDRHGNMEGYLAAKRRIFRHQTAGDAVIVGIDDGHGRRTFSELQAAPTQTVAISVASGPDGGVYVDRGVIYDAIEGAARPVADISAVSTLRGQHNWQNAAAAYAAVRMCGLTPEEAVTGFTSFPGLPHRMAEVARLDKVLFVNDSKATNVESAIRSLSCFENIYWIAGGRSKPGGFNNLLSELGNVRATFLIGEATSELESALAGTIPAMPCGTLDRAVGEAASAALQSRHASSVVLLAPACASFDQFANFEERGNRFEELVNQLTGGAKMGAGA